jgi:hypothetical protein
MTSLVVFGFLGMDHLRTETHPSHTLKQTTANSLLLAVGDSKTLAAVLKAELGEYNRTQYFLVSGPRTTAT